MIAREEARLRALFQRLLIVSLASAPAACSTSNGGGGGGQPDVDAAPEHDATVASDDGAVDAGGGSDATIDAPAPPNGGGDDYGYDDAACDPHDFDGAALLGPDANPACQKFEALPCGLPPDAATEGCFILLTECAVLCNQLQPNTCAIYECLQQDAGPDGGLQTIPAGAVTLECATGELGCGAGVGRRPEGLVASCAPASARGAVAWLAEAARLEGASVHAFRRLARELHGMRAPRSLVRAAERSARDEVRHARVTTQLARRRGARPARVVITKPRGARAIEAFAIENAVEGCVRECFGALVATRQAQRARDPEVAGAMRRIAGDETRHAALAWAIAGWLAPRLDRAARARVERAMRAAVEALRCEIAATPRALAEELGLPWGSEGRALVDGFAASLS